MDGFVGQGHFMYKGALLYNAIKNKTFGSAIFFGPSGTGKTTLARIIAKEMDTGFYELNAAVSGIKELKEIIDSAKTKFFGLQNEASYVYIDEFHRWNKLQQDTLLKALEEGAIKFIGSTTENPYFAVNNAVLSRVRSIYEFKRLAAADILKILEGALGDTENGFGNLDVMFEGRALETLADMSSGDARVALDTLGFIIGNLDVGRAIGNETIEEAMQRQAMFYDRSEDKYNLLSALQKSVRGSDPDAAHHYLARLIDGGADILMIGRRLLVMASEDVGMAYPSAITVVTSCVQAAQMVGFPEAKILLAQAVTLLAACPKSNASMAALESALSDLRSKNIDDVPDHLKDSSYSGAKSRGHGAGYKYPHAYGGYVKQQYLPDNLHQEGVKYYKPTENGSEASFKKHLESLAKTKGK